MKLDEFLSFPSRNEVEKKLPKKREKIQIDCCIGIHDVVSAIANVIMLLFTRILSLNQHIFYIHQEFSHFFLLKLVSHLICFFMNSYLSTKTHSWITSPILSVFYQLSNYVFIILFREIHDNCKILVKIIKNSWNFSSNIELSSKEEYCRIRSMQL